ncbi:MAG TPA: hypothetical protein VJB59_04875 [Bdellovibrionota bacterium]|nr:hypothetical protein [Bdellovibrionota bacterium]
MKIAIPVNVKKTARAVSNGTPGVLVMLEKIAASPSRKNRIDARSMKIFPFIRQKANHMPPFSSQKIAFMFSGC